MIDAIGLDADDTLWQNETLFADTEERLVNLIARHRPDTDIRAALYATEQRNLAYFGYGVKGFTLSMIETAIALTDGAISGAEIAEIINLAKAMIDAPIALLPHVAETVPILAEQYRLILITKGDLFLQEIKVARSGLAEHFAAVEIVSQKDPPSYARVLARHGIAPERFIMVGNAPKSDILPVLAIGARAVHIPFAITWAHEAADLGTPEGYTRLEHFGELPALLAQLE